jgi:hypothetical protein
MNTSGPLGGTTTIHQFSKEGEMFRATLYVPPQEWVAIKKRAKKEGISASEFCLRAARREMARL